MIMKDCWPIVEDVMKEAGFEIGPHCRNFLTGFISQADLAYQSDPARRTEAQANLRRFVLRMVQEAKDHGMPELHEQSFAAARQALCPLWPFC